MRVSGLWEGSRRTGKDRTQSEGEHVKRPGTSGGFEPRTFVL